LVLEARGKLHVSAAFSLGKLTQHSLIKKKKKKGPDYKSDREVKSKIIIRSKRRENVSALSL
jgi:hypothetical protein